MTHPHIKSLIAANCEGKRKNQYQSNDTTERVWQKMTAEMMVDLLDDASSRPSLQADGPSTSYMAGQLLRDMQRTNWCIRASPHEGGKGDSRGVDENLHITLRVGSTTYHVRCKEDPRLHVTQITS